MVLLERPLAGWRIEPGGKRIRSARNFLHARFRHSRVARDLDAPRAERTRDHVDRQRLEIARGIGRDSRTDGGLQVPLTIEVIPDDCASVPLEEAVEQRAGPAFDHAIADVVRERGTADDELCRGAAGDSVLESHLAFLGRAILVLALALDRQPPRADAGFEESLAVIDPLQPIPVALPL